MVGKDAEIDAGFPRKERDLDFGTDNCDCRGDTVEVSNGQGRVLMETMGSWLAEVSLDEVRQRLSSSTPNERSVSRLITVVDAPESGVAVIVEVVFPSEIST